MKIKQIIILVFCVILVIISSFNVFGNEKKLDSLLVHGKDFIFSLKEPNGWQADTVNASKLHANIIFYKAGESIQSANALIYIRVNQKYDEQVAKDLEWDMSQYKKRYSDIQFKDIPVEHSKYESYSKLFFIEDKFFEYVTYINPGIGKPVTISAAMNVQMKPASEEVFNVYTHVIKSLILLKP